MGYLGLSTQLAHKLTTLYIVCYYLADCGVPQISGDLKVHFDSTTEGRTLTFYCANGSSLNYTVTSVCTSEGRWSPDPSELEHLCEFSVFMCVLFIFLFYAR